MYNITYTGWVGSDFFFFGMENLVLHIPLPSEMGKHHCYAFCSLLLGLIDKDRIGGQREGIQMREAFKDRDEEVGGVGSGNSPWQPKMKNKIKPNHKPNSMIQPGTKP